MPPSDSRFLLIVTLSQSLYVSEQFAAAFYFLQTKATADFKTKG